jgi:hypothetical protein
MGKTSRMVHTLDCDWCMWQEHNRGVRMRRVDTETDAKFLDWQSRGMLDLGCLQRSPQI